MLENYATKIQFKFDMGLNDLGKTTTSSKTFDNLKNDFEDTSVLLELGELIGEILGANGVIETLRIVHEIVM